MGVCGENTARVHGITRADQDRYAARSYRLARAAASQGRFEDEIVAVEVRRL